MPIGSRFIKGNTSSSPPMKQHRDRRKTERRLRSPRETEAPRRERKRERANHHIKEEDE